MRWNAVCRKVDDLHISVGCRRAIATAVLQRPRAKTVPDEPKRVASSRARPSRRGTFLRRLKGARLAMRAALFVIGRMPLAN